MHGLPFPGMGVRAFRILAGLSAAVVLAAGCGTDGVPAETWAKHVCQALKPWSSQISALTRQTQEQMATVTTPDQAKINIVDLLDSEARASATARDRLLAAGVPAVDNGKKIADQFAAALKSARDAYATARDSIRKLPTASAGVFYQGVTKVIDRLNQQYNDGALDTSKIHSEELQKAFDAVPECQ
jgi:hypothetical protein